MGEFGIYGVKWSRMASYMPWLLRFEMRTESARAYRAVHKEREDIVNVQSDVEEHHVTRALRKLNRIEHDQKNAGEQSTKLGEAQAIEYLEVVKATRHYGEVFDKFIKEANKKGRRQTEFSKRVDDIALHYMVEMLNSIKAAEEWGGEDMRNLMVIINDASEEKKTARFMTAVRQRFKEKTNVSMLGRVALRFDIKKEFKHLHLIKDIVHSLELILGKIKSGKKKDFDTALKDFEVLTVRANHSLKELFLVAHKVMKRDLLLLIMLLTDEQMIEELELDWVQRHFLPEKPVADGLLKKRKLNKKLAEKAHTLALGLGVIIKGEKEVEAMFSQIIDESRS